MYISGVYKSNKMVSSVQMEKKLGIGCERFVRSLCYLRIIVCPFAEG
jgi:hypothetical protein